MTNRDKNSPSKSSSTLGNDVKRASVILYTQKDKEHIGKKSRLAQIKVI